MRLLSILLISLALTACKADESISGYTDAATVWTLAKLDGKPFHARATISFPSKGRAMGNAPCNRYSATQTAPLPWIEIRQIAATKMACADLAQETLFFDALTAMTLAEAAGNTLILSNDAGREMVFSPAP